MKIKYIFSILYVSLFCNTVLATDLINTKDMEDVLNFAIQKKVPCIVEINIKGKKEGNDTQDSSQNYFYTRPNYKVPITAYEITNNINTQLIDYSMKESFKSLLDISDQLTITIKLTAPLYDKANVEHKYSENSKVWSDRISNSVFLSEFDRSNVVDDERLKRNSSEFQNISKIISVINNINLSNPFNKLISSNLSDNYIDDKAASKLATCLNKINTIEILDLSNNNLTLKGLKSFESLLENKNFKYLSILDNEAASLKNIAALCNDILKVRKLDVQQVATYIQKIIFIPENWLMSYEKRKQVPNEYIEAHKKYFVLNKPKKNSSYKAYSNDYYVISLELDILQKQNKSLSTLITDALKDDPESCYRLGIHYYAGEDIRQNFNKAFYWQKKAADNNYLHAMYQLRYLYKNGLGVNIDDIAADRLWEEMQTHQDWDNYKEYYLGLESNN